MLFVFSNMAAWCARHSARLGASGLAPLRRMLSTSRGAAAPLALDAVPLDRAVLRVTGTDARKFLQNLCTNDMATLEKPHDAMFTCWLTPKGRTVTEMFISLLATDTEAGDAFLIDLDKGCFKAAVKHAAAYKLRSQVSIVDVSSVVQSMVFVPSERIVPTSSPPATPEQLEDINASATALRAAIPARGGTAFVDPRAATMGLRAHIPASINYASALGISRTHDSDAAYFASRVLHGFPEGKEVEDTVPMYWSFDYFGGVSFTKGCYLGQELIARTKHSGQVRRRTMPVAVVAEPPANGKPRTCGDMSSLANDSAANSSSTATAMKPLDAEEWALQPKEAGKVQSQLQFDEQLRVMLGLCTLKPSVLTRLEEDGQDVIVQHVTKPDGDDDTTTPVGTMIPLQPWWWQDMLAGEEEVRQRQ